MGQDLRKGGRARNAGAGAEPALPPPVETAPASEAAAIPPVSRRRWRSFSRSRPPIPIACCSTGWATSTSCSSRTRSRRREALGIVLTKRGKHLGDDIPMCGVPVHRADEYLQRLITKGFRVAVCEQMEDPAEARKRGSKAVVHRDVVRLVTPGTLTEESLLDAKARNYLTAVFKGPHGGDKATVALASLDISTGEFEVGEIPAADFPGEIVRLSPGEVDCRGHAPRRRRSAQMDRDRGGRRHAVTCGALRQPRRRAAAQSPARGRRSGRIRRRSRGPSLPPSARCSSTSS